MHATAAAAADDDDDDDDDEASPKIEFTVSSSLHDVPLQMILFTSVFHCATAAHIYILHWQLSVRPDVDRSGVDCELKLTVQITTCNRK